MEEVEKLFTTKIRETITEKRDAKLLAKRCMKSAQNYISSNGINDPNNYVLSVKLDYLLRKLTPTNITKIHNEEMRVKELLNTDMYEIDTDLQNYRDSLTSKIAPVNANSCSIYTCPRCKARDHTYKEIQARSIDEPKIVKCLCNVCNFRFNCG
jgi:DNA-directed RNA polymerase subunit M/transcription elongation factor TFIIS